LKKVQNLGKTTPPLSEGWLRACVLYTRITRTQIFETFGRILVKKYT